MHGTPQGGRHLRKGRYTKTGMQWKLRQGGRSSAPAPREGRAQIDSRTVPLKGGRANQTESRPRKTGKHRSLDRGQKTEMEGS